MNPYESMVKDVIHADMCWHRGVRLDWPHSKMELLLDALIKIKFKGARHPDLEGLIAYVSQQMELKK